MRVISKANASSLDFGGQTYEPGPDGVFNFPEPVGVELTTKHASMWVAEAEHLAAVSAAELDKLRDPNHMVGVVADLIGRVAQLEKKLAAAEAPEAPAEEQPPVEEPKKQPAAKKTAAKKAAAPGEQDPGTGGE